MEDFKVKSLAKALKVLECFNPKNPELGITQISSMLGIAKSSVSNIVSTFGQMGYLEQNAKTGRYTLGLKLLEYSYMINERLGYQRLFYDVMQDISKQFNAITYFAIYKDKKVFYLCNMYPPVEAYNYPYRIIIGETAPLYCTAIGKAMMAFLPGEELEKCLKVKRIAYTDSTITDEQALREEIAVIRKQGFALDRAEHEYGLFCMGVPVFVEKNKLFGAVSMSSPNLNFADEHILTYSRAMKEVAQVMRERIKLTE